MTVRSTIRLIVLLTLVFLFLLVQLVPPISRALVGFTMPILESVSGLGHLAEKASGAVPLGESGRKRLQVLEKEIAHMELELVRQRSLVVQNQELRQMLELPESPFWDRIIAPVVARDPASWNRQFRIGKGAEEGVKVGAAVLRGTDVIGRITTVSSHSALVITLADPGCRLSVRLQDSGAVGILNGRVGQTWHDTPICLIDFLPRDEAYRPGERVVTSGLGEAIPPGLRVGHVTNWEPGKTASIVKSSYAQVKMRPAAALNDFRYVAVLSVIE